MDVFEPAKRSEIMRRVRSKDTRPEMVVRSAAHRLGYRFRLHRRDLPGTPDLVFPRLRKVIFVHGCFWHGHMGCSRATLPKSNAEAWKKKIEGNCQRDRRAIEALRCDGWDVLVVWQCSVRNSEGLEQLLREFLTEGERT